MAFLGGIITGILMTFAAAYVVELLYEDIKKESEK